MTNENPKTQYIIKGINKGTILKMNSKDVSDVNFYTIFDTLEEAERALKIAVSNYSEGMWDIEEGNITEVECNDDNVFYHTKIVKRVYWGWSKTIGFAVLCSIVTGLLTYFIAN